MAIDTNSKAYKSLLDKGYTADQIQQMHSSVASGQSAKDVVANTKIGSTPISTTSTNTTNTTNNANANNIAMPEYQGTGGAKKVSSYGNQGAGNYTYNPTSGYYEKQSSTTPTTSVNKAVSDKWNSMSYDEQQEKLKSNPNLQDALTKSGLTIKDNPYANQGEGQYRYNENTGYYEKEGTGGPQKSKWDYQDNSPERMAEIAANLEGYKQTMPYLFNDKDAFDNFFINGKGRSQEQIDFLNDWFYKNQKYGKYDALTPDSIGYGIAYGDIPDDYLTMLKTTDPAKYQAVLQAKQDAEDKIKDKTALDTTSILSGDSEATITSKAIEWLKTQGLFLDKDGNLIDDRTENYATDEEKDYAKNAADIIARNLDIDNTVKHTYEDLVKKYPGATKATLMAMAQDTNSDLLREKENNNVELTRLQGYMNYMQSERQERNRIGEKAISQLQDQYGMYYDYTPEGMSELAQAKYAATNVTLDQADYGTDAQKQMALQRVLDGYYEKYGDIIQRSEAQVINDVMALAKRKGISLSQALEENFLKYLREKPGYSALSNGGTSPKVSFEKVGDTGYIFTVNPDGTYSLESVGGAATGSGVAGGTYNSDTGVMNFTESGMKGLGLKNNNPGNITDANVGEVGRNGKFAVFETPEDGFDALVAKIQNAQNGKSKNYHATATLYEFFAKYAPSSDNNNPKAYAESVAKQLGVSANTQIKDLDTVKFAAAIAKHDSGYNYDTYGMFRGGSGDNNNGYDPLLKEFFQKDPTKLTKDQWAKLKNMGYDERTYLSMRDNYLKNLAKEPDASTVKILDTLGYLMTNYPGREELMASIGTKFLPGDYGAKMGDYLSYVDYIKQNLTMDNLVKLKQGGATFGSLTEGERPRIEASATRLSNSMSKDKYLGELLDIYNTYAKNAGMGELTLDDINRMYGGSSSSSGTPTIKPMKGMDNSNVQVNNGDIDYDAVFASL